MQSYLGQISEKLAAYWDLERAYRSALATIEYVPLIEKPKKTQYGLFISGIAFCVVMLVGSLFTFNFGGAIIYAVITALFARARIKGNMKLLKISGGLLALTFLLWIRSLVVEFQEGTKRGFDIGIIFFLAVNIGSFVIAFFVASFLLKKYNSRVLSTNAEIDNKNAEIVAKNQRIQAHNQSIDLQRQQLVTEIKNINQGMVNETSWWFPTDYYAVDPVESFIVIVRNHRADTVKEMINVYIQDGHHNEIVANQQIMQGQIEQSLQNQEAMMRLQRTSNILSLVNCAANIASAHYLYKRRR